MRDSSRLENEIFAEQVSLLFKQFPISAFSGFIVSILFAYTLWHKVPATILFAWLGLLYISLMAGAFVVNGYRNSSENRDNAVWYRRYFISLVFIGLVWGSAAIFQVYNLSIFERFFLIIFSVGISSSALVVAIPEITIYTTYFTVTLAPMILWLLSQYPNSLSMVGGLGIFYGALLQFAGRNLNHNLVNTIKLKLSNMELVEEVRHFNENLEKRVQDKTKALFESEERFDLAMSGANDGLWDWDILENKTYYSPRWKSMLGYQEHELKDIPKEWRRRLHKSDRRKVLSAMRSHLTGFLDSYESIHRIQHKNGNYIWVLDRARALFDNNGKPYRMVGTQVDITEQKKLEEKFKSANLKLKHEINEKILAQNELAHLAKHDPLTELPNRLYFYEKLTNALHEAEIDGEAIAVLLVDLDNFKHVNDALGHPQGDKLLIDVAKRLTAIVNKNYFLSRFGGDEFLVILEGVSDTFLIDAYAREIIELISHPFRLDGQEVRIGCSIGITLFPDHGREPDALIRDADIAMYHAKNQGKNTYRYYNSEMEKEISEKARLRNLLHGVLERNELAVHYQPQVNTSTGKISGFEALVRWEGDNKDVVGPEIFVPMLEEIGLIAEVGNWVMRQACFHAVALKNGGLRKFSMSVNVSPKQFLNSDFVMQLRNTLEESGLHPADLEIEITENVFLEDLDAVHETLSMIKEIGVSVTLDDFGIGYSSLGYLKRFPINGVKIDKVFIQDLKINEDSRQLVTAIIAMAKGLNMSTLVAEGVENDDQLEILKKAGCPSYQGYLYSKPVPFNILANKVLPKNRLRSV